MIVRTSAFGTLPRRRLSGRPVPFCATVPGLPGVVATAENLEDGRGQLAEVVEEWVLVRVSQGLSVPRLGTARVQVRRAS